MPAIDAGCATNLSSELLRSSRVAASFILVNLSAVGALRNDQGAVSTWFISNKFSLSVFPQKVPSITVLTGLELTMIVSAEGVRHLGANGA